MNFPHLGADQFAVVQAEVATGIVLTTTGVRHTGMGEVYRIFDSFDAARGFAQQVVRANPKVECNLYDAEQRHVERITSAP